MLSTKKKKRNKVHWINNIRKAGNCVFYGLPAFLYFIASMEEFAALHFPLDGNPFPLAPPQ